MSGRKRALCPAAAQRSQPGEAHQRAARRVERAGTIQRRMSCQLRRHARAEGRDRRQAARVRGIEFEEQVPIGELAQRVGRRPAARIRFHPREFRTHNAPRRRVARPEAHLVVEPPGACFDAFIVALAELIRLDAE